MSALRLGTPFFSLLSLSLSLFHALSRHRRRRRRCRRRRPPPPRHSLPPRPFTLFPLARVRSIDLNFFPRSNRES